MTSNTAWQRHGCYKLGSEQYFNMPLEKAVLGCKDDWNSLDHFDPTAPARRQMAHMMYLRRTFPALQDGFDLVTRWNKTYLIQLPGSNGTSTEIGLWSVTRAALPSQNMPTVQQIWLLYTNENQTTTYPGNCLTKDWIVSPYIGGTTVKNLFFPFDSFQLQNSQDQYYKNGTAPYTGCPPSLTLDPYSFKAYVPLEQWVDPPPAMTKFSPGHDARIQAEKGDANATSIDIAFEYNTAMDCQYITANLRLNASSSGTGGQPTIRASSVNCQALQNQPLSILSGDTNSQWRYSATIDNVPDGIIELVLPNVPVNGNPQRTTGVSGFLSSRRYSLLISALVLVHRSPSPPQRFRRERHGLPSLRLR